MPDRAMVQEFISMMERGEMLESMRRFYGDDATAQENGDPPRVGLPALIAHEENTLARVKFESARAAAVAVDGETVAINWVFEMVSPRGTRFRLDEIALQEWRDGKIVSERYFYDPAQLRR